jgi:hypothetical protein
MVPNEDILREQYVQSRITVSTAVMPSQDPFLTFTTWCRDRSPIGGNDLPHLDREPEKH